MGGDPQGCVYAALGVLATPAGSHQATGARPPPGLSSGQPPENTQRGPWQESGLPGRQVLLLHSKLTGLCRAGLQSGHARVWARDGALLEQMRGLDPDRRSAGPRLTALRPLRGAGASPSSLAVPPFFMAFRDSGRPSTCPCGISAPPGPACGPDGTRDSVQGAGACGNTGHGGMQGAGSPLAQQHGRLGRCPQRCAPLWKETLEIEGRGTLSSWFPWRQPEMMFRGLLGGRGQSAVLWLCWTQHGLQATITLPKNLTPGPREGWVPPVSFHQDAQIEALCPGAPRGVWPCRAAPGSGAAEGPARLRQGLRSPREGAAACLQERKAGTPDCFG